MEISVDIEKLIKCRVTVGEYLLYYFIYSGESILFHEYLKLDKPWTSISELFQYGYVEVIDDAKPITYSNLRVTQAFIDTFIDIKRAKDNVSEWIDGWYDLFPKGVKTYGYLVRSDKAGCLKKMKAFCKSNPEFSKEIILKATKNYVDYHRINNYNGMQLAHYFISKNGISNLSGYCEAVKDKLDNGKMSKDDLSLGLGVDYSFDKSIN